MNKSIISILGALAAIMASPASAATITFVIGGFGEGATIAGSFTGTDLNNNGALELGVGVPNEITALTATYSGNSYSSGFTISLGDPGHQAMIYALGATTFAASSGPYSSSGLNFYSAAAGSIPSMSAGKAAGYGCTGSSVCARISDRNGVPLDSSDIGTITAAAVPEPASWAMMLGGFGLAGAAMRRKAARRAVA
jgi:hypothetical protein